jgi:alkyl sulfatase BDS1-like metallo-beta-lactamase superfamily hydrolase
MGLMTVLKVKRIDDVVFSADSKTHFQGVQGIIEESQFQSCQIK